MRAWVALLALGLAACGGEQTKTVDLGEGKTAEVTMSDSGEITEMETADGSASMASGPAARMPDDLPGYVPVYPGFTPMSVITGNQDGRKGGMITGEVKDPPEKVAAFYRERLKALGWESNSDMNLGGSMMITASSKTTGSVNAVVGAKEGGGTTLSLTYGDKES